jgi:hypothetical protein
LGDNGHLARDAEGRVEGGLRTALFDAPRAKNHGTNTGGGLCTLAGYSQPFSPAEMCSRYGNPGQYLRRYRLITDRNLKDRVILKPEADRLVAEAAEVAFDCPPK